MRKLEGKYVFSLKDGMKNKILLYFTLDYKLNIFKNDLLTNWEISIILCKNIIESNSRETCLWNIFRNYIFEAMNNKMAI